MKLLSLHVDNFGGLHDFDYSFDRGLTCIEADNGYGKSTLAEFIRAMLYGLPAGAKGKQKAEDSPRSRFYPWQGGVYGGTLDIETEQGRLRIARTFGKTQASDTFSLTDLQTRLPSLAYGEDIGIRLFGVDSQSYAKSTYLPQYEVEGLDKNNSQIVARLGNLLDAADDISSFDDADLRLAEYMKQYKLFRGRGGLIDEANDRRDDCIREIDACEAALSLAAEKRNELTQKRQRLEECEKIANVLNEEITSAQNEYAEKLGKYKRYKDLTDDAAAAAKEVDKYKAFFPQGKPTQRDLDEARKTVTRLEGFAELEQETAQTNEYREYYEIFGEQPLEQAELDDLAARVKELGDNEIRLEHTDPPAIPIKPSVNKKRKTLLIAGMATGFGVGAVLTVAGIIIPVWYLSVIGAILLAGGVLPLALMLNDNKKLKTALALYALQAEEYIRISEELNELSEKVINDRAALKAELSRFYGCCPGSLEVVTARLQLDNVRYRSICASRQYDEEIRATRAAESSLYKNQLAEFFARYGIDEVDDYDEALSLITDRLVRLNAAQDELNKKTAAAEKYVSEHQVGQTAPISPELGQKKSQYAMLRGEADRLRMEIGGLGQKIVQLEERAEPLPQKIDLAESLKADVAEYEKKRRAAELAREYLLRAKNSLSSKYLRNMENSFNESFSHIAGQSKAPEIDAELRLSFREGGESREPIWYSTGYRAIMEICLRLSLTESLFEGEKPFLILDDPFCDLDADKLERAKEMLRQLAESRQIIYLTCHPSRSI